MLSDEEREALQYFNTETKTEAMHYGAVLVKLIEKQSKEIERIIERLEAKPYTAYTLYGEILHESDEIAQMLKEILEKE